MREVPGGRLKFPGPAACPKLLFRNICYLVTVSLSPAAEASSEPVVRAAAAEGTLDALGVFLSLACLLHCLALPLLMALLPLTAVSIFSDERFHKLILLGVVPVSALALGAACYRRRAYRVALLGAAGVALIGYAAFGHELSGLSHRGETTLTVIGALLLSAAHLVNARANGLLHWHRRGDAHSRRAA